MSSSLICPVTFLSFLKKNGISSFYGVPDSLLKSFCAVLSSSPDVNHIISSNEGASMALAIGDHLASGSLSCIYLQNSGLGNLVNPLLSLASPSVYSIPSLLLIGWRGEVSDDGSQIKDEPQHSHQGLVTLGLLDQMSIKYIVLSASLSTWHSDISDLLDFSLRNSCPVAVVVRKNTFSSFALQESSTSSRLSREDSIKFIASKLPPNIPIFSTTGMASRELYKYRQSVNSTIPDFLTVGGMGHASSIALGFIRQSKIKRVVCLDGDGSVIMHMGSLFRCAQEPGFVHFVLNNEAHDSVGGQPTDSGKINFYLLSQSLGYGLYRKCTSLSDISEAIDSIDFNTSNFIEVVISKGARSNLGRPQHTPLENKLTFIDFWKN